MRMLGKIMQNFLLTNRGVSYNIILKFKIFETQSEMVTDYDDKNSRNRLLCAGAGGDQR